jgi:hypothetical protein
MRHSRESIPTTLVMLQIDLSNKKAIILQKMQILANIGSGVNMNNK